MNFFARSQDFLLANNIISIFERSLALFSIKFFYSLK